MKIATWNVNSMNVRLPHVVEWVQSHDPDVLVLQEIKQLTENFPAEELMKVGYHSIASGQKTYNGVATLSKTCLLYTSPSPRDQRGSRMPSSA